ncbi:protein S100-B-like [Bufo gargarizans]|uniref:protein S100-B-like n=1 Tax=Bufo gargarizans TaxID=30331 RepID=UPI001CF24400|nr:protein S100-B-like [Bufo gargarizans]
MVDTYNRFAGMEGSPLTMNTQEFREYLKYDIPVYIESKDPQIVEKTLASLDEDKDGELSYKEFLQFQMQYIVSKYNTNNRLQD